MRHKSLYLCYTVEEFELFLYCCTIWGFLFIFRGFSGKIDAYLALQHVALPLSFGCTVRTLTLPDNTAFF